LATLNQFHLICIVSCENSALKLNTFRIGDILSNNSATKAIQKEPNTPKIFICHELFSEVELVMSGTLIICCVLVISLALRYLTMAILRFVQIDMT